VTPGECSPLARSGWQSTTRLANTPTSMMMDIVATNRDNILTALHSYRMQLEKLEEMIRLGQDENLKAELDQGTHQYRSIQQQGK
jgi:prephenate dehydrogenase